MIMKIRICDQLQKSDIDYLYDDYHKLKTRLNLDHCTEDEIRDLDHIDKMFRDAYYYLDEFSKAPFLESVWNSLTNLINIGSPDDQSNLSFEERELLIDALYDDSSKASSLPLSQKLSEHSKFILVDEVLDPIANKITIQNISQKVLAIVKPEQKLSMGDYFDFVFNKTLEGELFSYGATAIAGSLGGTDQIIVLIVPAIMTILNAFLDNTGYESIADAQKNVELKKDIQYLTKIIESEISKVVKLSQSSLASDEQSILNRALSEAFSELFMGKK